MKLMISAFLMVSAVLLAGCATDQQLQDEFFYNWAMRDQDKP
jgi:hypothetical protein